MFCIKCLYLAKLTRNNLIWHQENIWNKNIFCKFDFVAILQILAAIRYCI